MKRGGILHDRPGTFNQISGRTAKFYIIIHDGTNAIQLCKEMGFTEKCVPTGCLDKKSGGRL